MHIPVSSYCLTRRAMLADVEAGRKNVRGGQAKTSNQSMKSMTVGMSHFSRCRIPSWGSHDNREQSIRRVK